MSSSRAEAVQVLRLFDSEESVLIKRAFSAITPRAPEDAAVLRHLMDQMSRLYDVVSSTRRLRSHTQLGREVRDERTLMEHLCHLDGLAGDLVLPMKATLSRTFLLSKIMFFRGFIKATSALILEDEEFAALSHHLRQELAQSIYTLLAEELLLALVRKPGVGMRTKRQAANQLITVWDNAALEIDDFCPLLESAWSARNRLQSGLGCLLGISEYFRLVSEDCAPQFLEFFARDEVSLAEAQAFEEFLFNLTFEEITTLRERMRQESLVTASWEWAGNVIGRPLEGLSIDEPKTPGIPRGEIDPMALYRSYYRRQLAADFRNLAGSDGPRRTAESYLMIWLFDQQPTRQ